MLTVHFTKMYSVKPSLAVFQKIVLRKFGQVEFPAGMQLANQLAAALVFAPIPQCARGTQRMELPIQHSRRLDTTLALLAGAEDFLGRGPLLAKCVLTRALPLRIVGMDHEVPRVLNRIRPHHPQRGISTSFNFTIFRCRWTSQLLGAEGIF